MNVNYNEKLKEIMTFEGKKTLLLHSCCGPCSTQVISRLKDKFDITVLYYNPNIEPKEEYIKRKNEQIRFIKEFGCDVKFMDIDYFNEEYESKIKGYEKEKEGGIRCHICYELRLEKTAMIAKDNNFDFFGTTLTVSPYKNAKVINEIGNKLENIYNINFLYSDFKKEDGYKKSIELSKKYNLYRQDYCGCQYSINNDINE